MYSPTDTIVAICTPPGEAGIGVIRISGANAVVVVNNIFSGKDLSEQPSHTLHFGRIKDGADVVDEVVVSIYKAPRSYTGEDIVEISCHGSRYILENVVRLCLQHGARPAKAGEFTQRAFLHGKLDLTQAEAVADLIAGESGAAHKAALHNLRGGFSANLKEMREQLIKFNALIELELDFSEEDVAFANRSDLYSLLNLLTAETKKLLNSFQFGNVIKNGVKVAIIGKPNAGKSTLLNALLNEERAIVSEIPGTTRDTIEETLNINGILFRLIDTAGIRMQSSDSIELKGIERSREAMKTADVVLHLFDVTDATDELAAQQLEYNDRKVKFLFVGNKTDAINEETKKHLTKLYKTELGITPVFVAAKYNEGIPQLKEELYRMVAANDVKAEDTIITNTRHYNALQEILKSLETVIAGMNNNLPGDLLSLDIRHCLYFLGELTGSITNEDTLDYIFSKFCIGK